MNEAKGISYTCAADVAKKCVQCEELVQRSCLRQCKICRKLMCISSCAAYCYHCGKIVCRKHRCLYFFQEMYTFMFLCDRCGEFEKTRRYEIA